MREGGCGGEREFGSVQAYDEKRDEEGTDGNMLGKRRRLCEYVISRLFQQDDHRSDENVQIPRPSSDPTVTSCQ